VPPAPLFFVPEAVNKLSDSKIVPRKSLLQLSAERAILITLMTMTEGLIAGIESVTYERTDVYGVGAYLLAGVEIKTLLMTD
jgi:hypothetical protein